ncbi:MAG: hypothetical protein ACRD3W_07495, partial [Terriglobales bacterium]
YRLCSWQFEARYVEIHRLAGYGLQFNEPRPLAQRRKFAASPLSAASQSAAALSEAAFSAAASAALSSSSHCFN